MEYEKKQDPATPPPPYASNVYASAPYQPGPYQPGPYPGGPGVPYNQPYIQQQHPVEPYSPQQGPYAQGGYPQQPAGTVIVQTVGQPVIYQQNYVSMIGAIVLSCFAFWCCGLVFGAIAFILALVGQNSSSDGNTAGAIRLRNASYAVSAVGIALWIVVVVIVVLLHNNRPYHY